MLEQNIMSTENIDIPTGSNSSMILARCPTSNIEILRLMWLVHVNCIETGIAADFIPNGMNRRQGTEVPPAAWTEVLQNSTKLQYILLIITILRVTPLQKSIKA